MTHTKKILERATQYSEGICQILDKCHCCNYRQEEAEIIPRLPRVRSSSWIISGDSSNASSFGGDSGGGSFGGGDSGGGGAGGDW